MDYQKPLDKVHHQELLKTLSHIDDMEMRIVCSVFHDHYTEEDTNDWFTSRKDANKDVSCRPICSICSEKWPSKISKTDLKEL